MLLWILVFGTDQSVGQGNDIASTRSTVEGLILENRFSEVEARTKRWLELAELTNDDLVIAESLDALTRVYAGLRRYDDAESVWRRCLELRVKALGSKHALVTKTIDVMTGIYFEQGRAAEARALWRNGLAAYQKRPPVAGVENIPRPPNLTVKQVPDLIAQGRWKEAEDLLRQNGDTPGLAAFLLDRGRETEAVALHRSLLESAPTADRAVNMAALYRQRRLYAREQEFLQKAITIQDQTIGPMHVNLIATLTALADSYESQHEIEKAYVALKRATSIATEIRTKETFTSTPIAVFRLRDPYLKFLRIGSLIFRDYPTRRSSVIDETFEAAQTVTETSLNAVVSQAGVRLSKGSGSLAQLIRQRQDIEQEVRKLDRLLLVAITAQDDDQNKKDGLRLKIAALEKQLSATDGRLRVAFPQYFDFAMPPQLRISDVQSLLHNNEALIQFAFLGDRSYVWMITKIEARFSVIAKTPAEIETAVSSLRCGLDYWGSWKTPRCPALLKRSYTDVDYRASKPLPFDLGTAYKLYATLFGAFQGAIANKDLLIVSSGPLSSLPLHVLITKKPSIEFPTDWAGYSRAPWFAKSHTMTTLPSVASLKALRGGAQRSGARSAYIAFGNPVLVGPSGNDNGALRWAICPKTEPALGKVVRGPAVRAAIGRYFRGDLANVERVRALDPLVETANEICAVGRGLGASAQDIFLADRATERQLKLLNRSGALEDYRVIHFATHGLLANESEILSGGPSAPSLVLTPPTQASEDDDGLLTAAEISQLKLNADWVILSACNTAGADHIGAEALSGLAQAFFYAGSRALLVSHWSVDNEAAVQLITQTFKHLSAGLSMGRAQALRSAMIGMIASGDDPAAHPAFWAPFVVVGEGAGAQ